MTIEEFGQQIKSKYPQYNDLSDGDLGNKMLQKYPQYQDMITMPSVKENKGLLSSIWNKRDKTWENIFKGSVKGVGSTAVGLGQLTLKGAKLLTPKQYEAPLERGIQYGEELKKGLLKPEGTAQQIGFTGEQIGEFVIPVGQVSKIGKGATLLQKSLNLLKRMGGEATEFAGKTAIQTGGDSKEVKEAATIGALAPPAIGGIKKITPSVGKGLASLIGLTIGKEPEHIIRAFKNPHEVAKKMAEKVIPLEVRKKAINALNTYRKGFLDDFQKGLDKLNQSHRLTKEQSPQLFKQYTSELKNSLTNKLQNIFRSNKVAVTNKGTKLNFDKLNSSIVKAGEKKNLQEVYNTIRNQQDFSPEGLQAVASRINALSSFAEGNKTLSSKTITEIHNAYSDLINKIYPELGKLRKEYSHSAQIWQGLDNILKSGTSDKVNPTTATSVARKLSNLFQEDNDAYLRAIEKLEKLTGVDLTSSLVASEFSNILPKGVGGKLFVGGTAIYNPILGLSILPLLSPKLQGKAITTSGKAAPGVKTTFEKLPKIITPLTTEK